MALPPNDDVISNFTTDADEPVNNKSISSPNSIVEVTNQSLNTA